MLLLSLGFLLGTGTDTNTMFKAPRCTLVGSEAPQQWLVQERNRTVTGANSLVENVRDSAWLPTISLKTRLSVDDEERLTLAETSQSSDYRTSAISRGGRAFDIELGVNWKLGRRLASPLELGIRRYQRQLQLDKRKVSLELSKAMQDWLLGLVKFCTETSPKRLLLYAKLMGEEARLDHFSDGRFSIWLKEQIH